MDSGFKTVTISRVVNVPTTQVFEAWVDTERLQQWFGPKGYTVPFCMVILEVGGNFQYCLRSPSGQDIWGSGIYKEIVEPSRLVYTDIFTDPDGHQVPPTYYGIESAHPMETTITVQFENRANDKTELILSFATNSAVADDLEKSWSESIDRLESYLASVK